MNKDKRNRILKYAGVALLLILLLGLYSYIPRNSPSKYVSPDENVFYFFANRVAEGKEIPAELPDFENSDLIYPRNTATRDGKMYPSGFLGIIIVNGFAGKIHPYLMTLMIPLLGVIGIVFFFFLIKEVFDKKTAWLSSIILAFAPPWLFWSNMSFFNNIPTATMFTGGLLFLFKFAEKKKKKDIAISAALFSFAAWFRYEIVVLIAIVMTYVIIKEFKKKLFDKNLIISMILFAILFVAVMSPILYLNNELYGGPISVGYDIGKEKVEYPFWTDVAAHFMKYALPSGIRPQNIVRNSYDYFIKMLPLFTALGLAGIVIFSRYKKSHLQKIFAGTFVVVTIVLSLYYSSGVFYGFKVPTPYIFSSYARYLLPIYMFMAAFAGIFLKWLLDKNKLIVALLLILIVGSSVVFAFNSDQAVRATMWRKNFYQNVESTVAKVTPEDAILFTRYWDKAIFPARMVVTRSFGGNHAEAADVMVGFIDSGMDVYFVGDREGLSYYDMKEELKKRGYNLHRRSKSYGGIYEVVAK